MQSWVFRTVSTFGAVATIGVVLTTKCGVFAGEVTLGATFRVRVTSRAGVTATRWRAGATKLSSLPALTPRSSAIQTKLTCLTLTPPFGRRRSRPGRPQGGATFTPPLKLTTNFMSLVVEQTFSDICNRQTTSTVTREQFYVIFLITEIFFFAEDFVDKKWIN